MRRASGVVFRQIRRNRIATVAEIVIHLIKIKRNASQQLPLCKYKYTCYVEDRRKFVRVTNTEVEYISGTIR